MIKIYWKYIYGLVLSVELIVIGGFVIATIILFSKIEFLIFNYIIYFLSLLFVILNFKSFYPIFREIG